MDMSVTVSALSAFGSGMQATGHNIANVSTRDFEPQTYTYMSGPADQSVVFVPKAGFEPSSDPPSFLDPTLGYWTDISHSPVDVPREMVNMIVTQSAYEANTRTIGTMEEMSGVLLDMVV